MKKLLQKWHWIHTWSKWEQYKVQVFYVVGDSKHEGLDTKQRRNCVICNKQQIESLS